MGPYLIPSAVDKLEFSNDGYWYVFWITNSLMFVIPQVFALYCYQLHAVTGSKSLTKSPSSEAVSSFVRHSYNTRSKQKTQ